MGQLGDQVRVSFNTSFRDSVTDGVAASGPNKPKKKEIRATGSVVGDVVDTLTLLVSSGRVPPLADVACATTANITLSGEQTLDGVLTSASRVLVRKQTSPAQNGVYVSGSGAWTRATDADTATEIGLAEVYVSGGTTLGGNTYQCQQLAQSITLGSTGLVWALTQSNAGLPVETARAIGKENVLDNQHSQLSGVGERSAITNYAFDPSVLDKFTTPPEFVLAGGSTAVINTDGLLEVSSDYTAGNTKRCILKKWFREGVLSFAITRGNSWSLCFHNDLAGAGYFLRSEDGHAIKLGYRTASGAVVTDFDTQTLPGSDGDVLTVRLQTGPIYEGSTIKVHAWGAATDIPALGSTALISATVPSGKPNLNEGKIILESVATKGVAKFGRISIWDGTQSPLFVEQQASFIGRWKTRYESFGVCKWTNREGDRWRFKGTGSDGWWVNICQTADAVSVGATAWPYIYVFVNGVAQAPIAIDKTSVGWQLYKVASGCDVAPGTYTEIEIRLGGLLGNSSVDGWNKGYGLCVGAIIADTGATTAKVAPWPDGRSRMLFIGDSITAGKLARVAIDQSASHAGDSCFGLLAGEDLGRCSLINGYGGTGIDATGGNFPETIVNFQNYMAGCPIDMAAEKIDTVWLAVGTNTGGLTESQFQPLYYNVGLAIIQKIRPSRIYFQEPLNTNYATPIQAVVTALSGFSSPVYVDTSGWTDIEFVDGTHPSLAGHRVYADHVRDFVTSDRYGNPQNFATWAT